MYEKEKECYLHFDDRTAHETVERFKNLEKKYQDLSPFRFELPIQSQSAEAYKFASKFVKGFEGDTNKSEETGKVTDSTKTKSEETGKVTVEDLAKQFRIVQWEILVWNHFEESFENRLNLHPMSVEKKITGIVSEDYLKTFVNDTREIECRFEPSYGQIPTKIRNSMKDLSRENIILDREKAEEAAECRKSFDRFLREISDCYSFVHKDLVKSFTNARSINKPSSMYSNIMLIEDGEMSFFSLLWLLRYARHKDNKNWETKLNKWIHGEENEKLTIRFRVKEEESSSKPFIDIWSECNMYEFSEEFGLIICLPESQCVPTRRFRSLITWLRCLNDNLKKTYKRDEECLQSKKILDHSNTLLQRLHIKILDYDEDRTSFIKKLWGFLASNELTETLNQCDKYMSDASLCYECFTQKFGCLVKSLDESLLLQSNSSVGLDDLELLRCSRGFVPLEHLIRVYKPCEASLIISGTELGKSAP